jgi:hypothetical protein
MSASEADFRRKLESLADLHILKRRFEIKKGILNIECLFLL